MRVKQINNIVIHLDLAGIFYCKAAGRILEEFVLLSDAEEWCRQTKDFVKFPVH